MLEGSANSSASLLNGTPIRFLSFTGAHSAEQMFGRVDAALQGNRGDSDVGHSRG